MRETIAKSACAGSRDAVSLLALFLYSQAGEESVRTREAVAATIANQVNGLLRAHGAAAPTSPVFRSLRARLFIERLDRTRLLRGHSTAKEEPAFASCWRIAVSGALQDPTGGAVRYPARLGLQAESQRLHRLLPLLRRRLRRRGRSDRRPIRNWRPARRPVRNRQPNREAEACGLSKGIAFVGRRKMLWKTQYIV